jgi:hypothetical protein
LSLAAGIIQFTIAEQFPASLFTTMFGGQEVNTGGWLSFTVTVKLQFDELPPASVAVNVTVVVPTGNAEPLGKPPDNVIIVPGQLSVAEGAIQFTIALHKPGSFVTVMFNGHEVKVGNWLSITVTVKEHVEVFPAASVAV